MTQKLNLVKISKRTSLKIADHKEISERLYNAIWICKVGNLSETEALDFINSGELGYYEQTEQEITNNVKVPITITRTTYYKYKSFLESPEYQTKQVFKLFRDEYVTEIIQRFKFFKTLEAESLRSLKQETDPYKKQLIINGIFKNSPFTTSLMDEVFHMLKYKKMPFSQNEQTQRILEEQK
ncbi:hypothetical protein [Candidatus Nitrosarchaeum limnium]|uniref:Uncharacterized protein n=1 Tax=Candidatus Nitrosarchaeum limnium BG20 TaxID=859192 RepID=S2E815_9ARCH|nr:hypothetical protein [Candidatus Nitrosarchaeum limnium]EPA06868.1 hypothetical protein BG20_I1448 [Candidatus Nitrosarchaeum limnium BG20]